MILGLAVSVGASAAIAQSAPLSSTQSSRLDIHQICNAVSAQIGSSEPSDRVSYQYQELFRAAAGIENSDAPEVVRFKMQQFWLENRQSLQCNQLGFSIRNGNIAKLAFERSSEQVILDFVRRWALDLNFLDPADGKTILDFVEAELEESRGYSNEPIWRRYRDMLIRSGAKRADQL